MKKTYLLSSIIAFTLLLSGTACAEISSSTMSKIDELKQKVDAVRQMVQEEKNKIASTTEDIKGIKQELINAVETRINKRLDEQKMKVAGLFEDSIARLKDLISRIESRITKMDAKGADTSSSKTLLVTAKSNLSKAELELTNLENILSQNIAAISTSTTRMLERKNEIQKIRVQSEKTKLAIKTTQKSIVDVINSLKLGLEKEKKATSTEETSSSTKSN